MPRLIMRCRRTSPMTTRVAGVHASDMRADRGLEATRVVAEHEGVVAFWVGPNFRIVLVRSQCQRRATGPTPDNLGSQPLLLGAVLGVLAQVLAEGGYARVQLAEDCVGAVAAQHIGLRYWGDVMESRPRTPEELAGLERHFVRIGAGNASTLDGRMADAIRETEHVAQVSRQRVHSVARWARRPGDRVRRRGRSGKRPPGGQYRARARPPRDGCPANPAVSPSARERSPRRPQAPPLVRPFPAETRAGR